MAGGASSGRSVGAARSFGGRAGGGDAIEAEAPDGDPLEIFRGFVIRADGRGPGVFDGDGGFAAQSRTQGAGAKAGALETMKMMFRNHVNKKLTAYLHGELRPEESRRVAEHMLACRRCRDDYEEVKFAARLVSQLAEEKAPAEL